MYKFWDENKSLTPNEMQLLTALYEAHAQCVFRENCSTMALQQAAFGSHDIVKSYIAALATLGDFHGPIEAAYEAIFNGKVFLDGSKIPGFGNSFIKGVADPAFAEVHKILKECWPKTIEALHTCQRLLKHQGKDLYPNPAGYTACVARAIGMPSNVAPALFVQARLQPWTELFYRVVNHEAPE